MLAEVRSGPEELALAPAFRFLVSIFTNHRGKLARSYLLVFDLGGGTFDVSVMEALVRQESFLAVGP